MVWMLLLLLAVGLPSASVAEEKGAQYVETYCTVCHGEDLIHQQRLTESQWRAEVDKMAAWGAQVQDAAMQQTLVSYLAEHYGPESGVFAPGRIEPQAARAAVEPQSDKPFGGGDVARGKQLYAQNCMACHGPSARGQIGVNLVDRYMLYRARDFAAMARKGRGLMPGRPVDDAGVADLLAYLRSLPADAD